MDRCQIIELIKTTKNKIEWAKKFPFDWPFYQDYRIGDIVYIESKVGKLIDKEFNCIVVNHFDGVEHYFRPGSIIPEVEERILMERHEKTKQEMSEEYGISIGQINYILYHRPSSRFHEWSDNEDEILHKYKNESTYSLSTILSRCPSDVKNRRRELGLIKSNKSWSDVDDDEFLRMYKEHSAKELAKIYRTTEESVRWHISVARRRVGNYEPKSVKRLWTREEVEFLKTEIHNMSKRDIADALSRSFHSIRSKLRRIGE